jgi:DNA-directed RNA polymerase subunit M/transcription elongation factor TFIIS
MSDGLNAGKNVQRMLPPVRTCSQCGGSAAAISILNTRSGKSFRLYRCASCGGLAWVQEEQ